MEFNIMVAEKMLNSWNAKVDSIDMQHKAIEYGMNDFVPKPFNPYDLYNIVFKYTLEAPSRIKP